MGIPLIRSKYGKDYVLRLTLNDASGTSIKLLMCLLCNGAVFEPDIDEHDLWHEVLRKEVLKDKE